MIKTHFFGKDCIVDRSLKNRDNLALNLKNLQFNFQNIMMLNQIHSNEVVVIDDKSKIFSDQDLPKADGIVTNLSEVILAIFTADCAAILFSDDQNKIIGACHAGWRGAKRGIIEETVKAMKKLGAKKISAKIGPMIQQMSYEVSPDFNQDFLNESSSNQKFFKASLNPDKFNFDLCGYVEQKISDLGITDIENNRIDTYDESTNFFSYRRATHQGLQDCGRNIAVIAIN
ncbi:MAG: hypothetical protein RL769_575 [Pseudomonadota bacterium]|jgi:YfiH family protein